MLKLDLSKQSMKFLQSLPLKQSKQIQRKLMELSHTPMAPDAKRLKGYTELLRVDSGEYRVVYRINTDEQILMILAIGKRNDGDIYKKLKRMF